jgi:hypothetical protein
VGDDDSLSAFYTPESGQERGREGTRRTAMVDLQCVDLGVEEEPVAEMMEGRGGNNACVLKEEGRGCDWVERT